jgi:hypothetical protein
MSVETYTALVTSEHAHKPKFIATIEANAGLEAFIQSVLSTINPSFDLDSAVGVQLDTVGVRVGVSRFIATPLSGIYFEWDNAALGWSFGIWKGVFSPTTGLTLLPDDSYRTLIRAKIAANSWKGSIPDAYTIWETLFTDTIVLIQDNQDMSMVIGVTGQPLDVLTQALLIGGYLPLKPEGVRIAYYALHVDTNPLFAWGADGSGVAGWGIGSWAKILAPT